MYMSLGILKNIMANKIKGTLVAIVQKQLKDGRKKRAIAIVSC